MGTFDCIGPLKSGMKSRRDMISLVAETLARMFEKGEEDLVGQVSLSVNVKRKLQCFKRN